MLFCIGVLPAQGQTQQADTTIALSEIQIGALRASGQSINAPYASSLLFRPLEVVAFQPGLSLQSVLKTLPGVWINNRGHFALGERLIIRGMGWRSAFGVRGVQVLLDGIPLTLPDGQGMLDIIDPAFIRQAEVVRGPSSTFWGNGSGGVLMLSTHAFQDSSSFGIRAMTGSYGTRQGSAEIAVPLGRHRLQGYLSRVQQEGYRDYSEGSFIRSGINALVDLGPTSQLRLMAALAVQDTESPGSLTTAQIGTNRRGANARNVSTRAGKESQQIQVGATLFKQTRSGLLSVTAYGISRMLDNPLSFTFIDLDRQVAGTRIQLEREEETWRWGVGIDAALQSDKRRNLSNEQGFPGSDIEVDQQENVQNVSAFATAQVQLSPRIRVSGSGRIDGIRFSLDDHIPGNETLSGDRSFSAFSPSLGLTYEWESVQLYTNASTAFETPTTTELVNQPTGGAGLNDNVGAQKTRGVELGMRGKKGAASFDVAAFSMQITDRLLPFQDEDGRTYYRNAGRNTHRGIEIGLNHALGSASAFQMAYTGSDFVFSDTQLSTTALGGNRIPGIPVHHIQAALSSMYSGFTGELSVEWVSDMYSDNENETSNDGYVVLDLNMGYTSLYVQGVHVWPFLQVSNLLDAQYIGSLVINAFGGRYFEPSPSRTLQFGVRVDF